MFDLITIALFRAVIQEKKVKNKAAKDQVAANTAAHAKKEEL
jgi:hypothetical protein